VKTFLGWNNWVTTEWRSWRGAVSAVAEVPPSACMMSPSTTTHSQRHNTQSDKHLIYDSIWLPQNLLCSSANYQNSFAKGEPPYPWKVTWCQTRMNFKNLSRKIFDIVPETRVLEFIVSLLLACILAEEIDFEMGNFRPLWPWPWLGSNTHGTPSCSIHRPLPAYQISLKSEKLFVDGWTDLHTYVRTDRWVDGHWHRLH